MPKSCIDRDWLQILRRLDSGDGIALGEIETLVSKQLRSMPKPPPWVASDDVVQDVLIDLIRAWRRHRIREPERLPGFVRTLARRRLADTLGHERRACALDRAELNESAEAEVAALVLGSLELGIDVRRALASIDSTGRRALEAVYGLGLTYEEAARALGLPLGTLKRRLSRAIRRLQAELAPAGMDGEADDELQHDGPHSCARSAASGLRRDARVASEPAEHGQRKSAA